jgi:hypothetical protein
LGIGLGGQQTRHLQRLFLRFLAKESRRPLGCGFLFGSQYDLSHGYLFPHKGQ